MAHDPHTDPLGSDLVAQALAAKRTREEAMAFLWEMTPAEREAAMWRGELTFDQCSAWARRAPHEVPLIQRRVRVHRNLHARDRGARREESVERRRVHGWRYRHLVDARTAIDLPIDIDGRRVRSETLQASLSPYVVTIGTTLPAEGVSLYSTYHGHPGALTVSVHLTRTRRQLPQTRTEAHAENLLPVIFGRARCLRDHALRLQETLEAEGYVGAIHLSDEAELAVEAGRGAGARTT